MDIAEHRVQINVTVSCSRSRHKDTSDQEPTNSDQQDGSFQHEDAATLEDLDCRFVLFIFGAEHSQESPRLTFEQVPLESTVSDGPNTYSRQKLKEDLWSHTFLSEVLVSVESVIQLCRSEECSIVLKKSSSDSAKLFPPSYGCWPSGPIRVPLF